MSKQRRKNFIILLGITICTFVLRSLANTNQLFVEKYYSRGLFQGIRWIIDHSIAWIPFPLIYLFFILVFGLLIYRYSINIHPLKNWKNKLFLSLKMISMTAMILYCAFHWLWGFNYARVPIEDHLSFTPKALSKIELESSLKSLTPILLEARSKIPGITDQAIDESFISKTFESDILSIVEKTLIKYDYPVPSKVNARLLKPKGLLKGFGAIGIYFPFVGESNMDTALHPLQWPEVLAHEFSHAYGFGDEGTCSFIAYLCLKDSKDPFLHYAGMLDYWRGLATNYLQYEPEIYKEYRASLPEGLVNDLNAINEQSAKYRVFFPKFKRAAYDAYLKSQGIDEGIENYNRVLMLVEAFNKVER